MLNVHPRAATIGLAVAVIVLLVVTSIPRSLATDIANQTIITFVEKVEVSEAGNGSYFPSFNVEERAGWPRLLWPRGEAESRRVLVELATRELDNGATVVLFAGRDCPRCSLILDLFRELDVPAHLVEYAALDTSDEVKNALRQLDVTGARGSDEPAVFLGTRLLGMALEVEAMLYTGELHARLRVYGILPRSKPPVNRAPVVRIQPRATRPEAERLSVAWESSWVHPRVLGVVQVTVLEAKDLTAFSYSYDPEQRRVLRGALPTPGGSIFGRAVSNPYVQVELEGVSKASHVQRETLHPVWNFTATFLPVRNPGALLELRVQHADEKPPQLDPFYKGDPALEMGKLTLRLPQDAREAQHWYSLVGNQPGDRVTGMVHVRLHYRPFYHLRVQAGRRVRIGGILVEDADALNATIRALVECDRGFITLPSNPRLSWLLGDPRSRVDPRQIVNAGSRGTHLGVLFEPPARIGFRLNDGEHDRRVMFEGSLEAVQAALAELEYEAPSALSTDPDTQDCVRIQVDDLGHTGSGGRKVGAVLLNLTVFAGPDNQPPVLHMWPAPASAESTNVDGVKTAERQVPRGEEGAIYGLYVDDDDLFGGRLSVSIVAQFGAVSLRGLGPWSRSAAARASFDAHLLEGIGLQVRGRQVTIMEEKGFYTRYVLCTWSGGFADEFVVQGPVNGRYSVRSNTLPGEAPQGSTLVVRPYTLLAGHCLPLHHDAQADFELQYTVQALESGARVNVLLLDEINYQRYVKKQFFAYHKDGSSLASRNATMARVHVQVKHAQRWHLVIEETIDLQKPGWRFDQGGAWWEPGTPATGGGYRADWRQREGEYQTGHNRSLIHLLYHVKFQRSSFSEESFVRFTQHATLDRPSATRVCGWILSAQEEEQFVAPPGTTLLGLEFTQGDGHGDKVMRFTGPLSSVQHALASLSYTSSPSAPSDTNVDRVTVTVDDNGHSGAGGPKSASFVILVETVGGPGVNATKLSPQDRAKVQTGGGADALAWVAEVREDNKWLDIVLQQLDIGGRFADPHGGGPGTLGPQRNLRSIAVPPANYTAPGLASALSERLREAYGDFFSHCKRGSMGEARATSSVCWQWGDGDQPPVQFGWEPKGGAIEVHANETSKRFTFVYDPINGAEPVTNGQYINARPCEQGGGLSSVNNSCGWWGGRFSLLFESGPNRERSLALLLGFDPDRDYSSSLSQHMGGTLGAMTHAGMPGGPASLQADHWHPARLHPPMHYFRDLGAALPPVRSLMGTNRAPTLSLPFKTRADMVSVSVPAGSMEGKCRVRDSGISYAGVRAGVGGLEVDEGVGLLVNRWYVIEEGEVVLRDYRFERRFVPEPSRAQWTYEWDHSVIATEVQLIMPAHGIIQAEAFVGGTASAWTGQYDAQELNQGWISLGVVNGSAGHGPFSEGTKSVFRWPQQSTDAAIPGRFLRVIVRKVFHQKKWGLYRAFPSWRQATHLVDGLHVQPHLVRAVAGEETSLKGADGYIEVDDIDLGEDPVGAYSQDTRHVRVEIEALHGELFVDAPFVDVEAAGPQSGDANRLAGQAYDDAAAQGNAGDVQLGQSPSQNLGIPGNVKIKASPWLRAQVEGVDVVNTAKLRGLSAGVLYFLKGGGTADRRMVFHGRLSAVQRAVRGLRYKSRYKADPAAQQGGRLCTHGLMCGQSGGAQANYMGSYGGAGNDVITLIVDDLGNSQRVCADGGADPLGECVVEPAAPLRARAVLQVTVVPKASNSLGQRASDWIDDPPCKSCYQLHPLDDDLCLHVSRYWAAPDVPGHSYRISTWNAYTEAQRLVWDQEFSKPCDGFFRTSWSDLGGDIHLSDSSAGVLENDPKDAGNVVADTNSHAHGVPSIIDAVDDDVQRFMESLNADAQHTLGRPWEGR